MTKLYDIPDNTKIRVIKSTITPPFGNPSEIGQELTFIHIDGMYSLCYDKDGNIIHLAAWTEVEIL